MTLACRRGVPRRGPKGSARRSPARYPAPPRPASPPSASCSRPPRPRLLAGRPGGRGGLLCAELLLRRCVRRFAGVTGDVFGALCEVAATSAYITLTFH